MISNNFLYNVYMRYLLCAAFLIVMSLLMPGVYAQEPSPPTPKMSGLEISPAILDIEIPSTDEEKTVTFYLTNHTQGSMEIELFALDFQQQQDSGIVQFLSDIKANYTYSLASFVSLPFESFTLESQEEREIPIVIRNRQDLSPGGHYAALVARIKAPQSPGRTVILPSVAALMLVHKTGGELYNMSLRDYSFPKGMIAFQYPKKIDLLFRNEGNIHLIPRGTIEVRDMRGKLVSKGQINVSSGYVFPTSRRSYSIEMFPVGRSYPISFNTVHIEGTDSLHKTVFLTKQSYVYVNPYLLGMILLVGVFGIYKKWQRIRRRSSQ
jgi:hypothetical protein